MKLFDDDGYYNSTKVMDRLEGITMILNSIKSLLKNNNILINDFDTEAMQYIITTVLKDLVLKNKLIVGVDSIEKTSKDLIHVSYLFHSLSGCKSYKIRKNKVEYLKNIQLKIPSNYIILPHKCTHVMLPFDSLYDDGKSISNIYIIKENIEKNIEEKLNEYYGKKVIGFARVLAIKDSNVDCDIGLDGSVISTSTDAVELALPIIDGVTIQQLFELLMDRLEGSYSGDNPIELYNFITNFLVYLTIKDPDIKESLGIKEKIIPVSLKKIIKPNHHAYQYYDVGRLYDERIKYEKQESEKTGKKIKTVHLVRAHIRLQWHGPRQDDKPGTHQVATLIEEFIKGGGDIMDIKAKTIEVVGDRSKD